MNEQDPIQALTQAMEQSLKQAFMDGVQCGMEQTLERLNRDELLITPERVKAVSRIRQERDVLALKLERADQTIALLGGVADDNDDTENGNLQFKH